MSDEIDALVAFMEALTDDRVLYRRAPFDHPQIFVPNGHPTTMDGGTVDANKDGLADDIMIEIPAVGALGGAAAAGVLDLRSSRSWLAQWGVRGPWTMIPVSSIDSGNFSSDSQPLDETRITDHAPR